MPVARALKHPSAEVRARARRILAKAHHEYLREGFRRLGRQQRDEDIDLTEGMLLIAQLVDPATDRRQVVKELDRLAAKVRRHLGNDVPPRAADPQKVVQALQQVLFVDEGFNGNADDYDNPRNSSLAYVLETRRGLPILLSHLVVAVGQRLDMPLVGIPIPYRYMVKYEGLRAPDGYPKTDIILDAFGAGQVVTEDDLEDIVTRHGGGFDPLRHLLPSTHRGTITRMLRNLQNDYAKLGDLERAERVGEYVKLVDDPEAADSKK
jgi:regulator of sirC expression with transglutaminase-like and TPR domain